MNEELFNSGNAIVTAQAKDRERSIPYKPEYNAITGSVEGSILLQQMLYWWYKSGRKSFYKFRDAAEDTHYRNGDSWIEELGFTGYQFDRALKSIAVKITTGKNKSELRDQAFVIYWTDSNRLTWYEVNETIVLQFVALAYQYPKYLGNFDLRNYLGNCDLQKYLDNCDLNNYLVSETTQETNSKSRESTFACEAQARASTPADLEHQTPAPEDNLPPESVEQEHTVAVSADCKDSIATLFDAPAPVAPDPPPPPAKTRQPNARQQAQAALEEHFHAKTKLPLPARKTAAQIKSAARLWWTPLAEIWGLCDQDTERAKKLICLTVDHLRAGKMTVANPNSIVKTATAIYTGNVPGVKMPHEKKLTKYILTFPDGHTEEVEEYV